MLRSIVSRVTAVAEQTLKRDISKVTFSQRLLHTHSTIMPTKTLLTPISSVLRPLGSVRHLHDTKPKGDDELVSFLSEEIATEKKNERGGPLPKTLEGFEVQLNQSEITLTRKYNNETVSINLNVNHTVDADYSEEAEQKGEKDAAEMRSRPNFEIDIQKGKQVLTFSCSYLQDTTTNDPQQDEYQDAFVIDEISLCEGEWNEQVYAVAGDILDGYLYDLFMNMLEERGVTNEFVDKLSDFATDYEHKLYINMLGQLQNFFNSK